MTQGPNAGRRLLVVDDEELILQAFEWLLGKHFTVVKSKCLRDARTELNDADDFAVVIADHLLPDGDGIALLRDLKNSHPNTARVLITGQAKLEPIVEAINRAEIHRFILKPWDTEVLKAQIFEAAKLHELLKERNEDQLTGIPNRRYFHECLAMAIERAKSGKVPFGIIMVDLDKFKSVNDRHGHSAGDRLLKHFALSLRQVTARDGIVARIGGDEFAILCFGMKTEELTRIGARIHSQLSGAIPSEFENEITISMGAAGFPDHASPENLLETADRALLDAKRSGRNRMGLPISANDE